jgi:hypothetical protein
MASDINNAPKPELRSAMELPAVEQRYRPHSRTRHRFIRDVFRARPVYGSASAAENSRPDPVVLNANPSIELNHKIMNRRLTTMRKVRDTLHPIVRAHLVTSRRCRWNSRLSISSHCRDRTQSGSELNDILRHGLPPCIPACPRLQPARRRSWIRLARRAPRQGRRSMALHQRRPQGSEPCPPPLSSPPRSGGSL